jgi:hypothetical protein
MENVKTRAKSVKEWSRRGVQRSRFRQDGDWRWDAPPSVGDLAKRSHGCLRRVKSRAHGGGLGTPKAAPSASECGRQFCAIPFSILDLTHRGPARVSGPAGAGAGRWASAPGLCSRGGKCQKARRAGASPTCATSCPDNGQPHANWRGAADSRSPVARNAIRISSPLVLLSALSDVPAAAFEHDAGGLDEPSDVALTFRAARQRLGCLL